MATPEWRKHLEDNLSTLVCMPTDVLNQNAAMPRADMGKAVLKNIQSILSEVNILATEGSSEAGGMYLTESPSYTVICVRSEDSPETKIAHILHLAGHLDLGHIPSDKNGMRIFIDIPLSQNPTTDDEILQEQEFQANRWTVALIDRVARQPSGHANPDVANVLKGSAKLLTDPSLDNSD